MKISGKSLLAGAGALVLAVSAWGQDKLPKPTPVPAPAASPALRIVLGPAEASATPYRRGHACAAQTGSGEVLVTQPAPHMIVATMTGSALAKGHLTHQTSAGWTFDLSQEFAVVAPPDMKIKLSVEGKVVGQLRSTHCCSHKGNTTAECGNAHASITCGAESILGIDIPPRTVACGENQFVYGRAGPNCLPVPPACYVLHQTFSIGASVHKCPFTCKAVAAEFSPERHLDPAYFGVFDALIGCPLRENGYRVTVRVVQE